MTNKTVEYINGMIFLDWKYLIPKDPKEAIAYIKEMRKPAIERTVEQMEDSEFYFEMKELDELYDAYKKELKDNG